MAHQKISPRGRSVFVWFWGFFVLIQGVGGYLLDYQWPRIRFPAAFYTFDKYDEQTRSPDVICLGSSRTQSSLFPTEMELALRQVTGNPKINAFNAFVPGGDLISSEYVLKELWQRGARPKVVTVEVLPEETNHLNDWLKLHVLRQLTWENMPDTALELVRTGHFLRLLRARVVPLYTHRYELVKRARMALEDMLPAPEPETTVAPRRPRKAEPPPEWTELIKRANRVTPAVREETMKGLPGVARGLRNYRIGGSSTRAMNRLLDFCEEHQIAVLLVGIPVSKPHRDLYTPEIDAQFLGYMKQLEETRGVRFVDCRHYTPDRMFFDNHHADGNGGRYFSQRFTREHLVGFWNDVSSGGAFVNKRTGEVH